MLFNSYVFILAFLPGMLAVFHLLQAKGEYRYALVSLSLGSLLFYAWWSPPGLALLMVLMLANYVMVACLRSSRPGRSARQLLLLLGVSGNLAVLCYFKYSNFLLENWSLLTGSRTTFVSIALPLGISFFIFQKIALVVDAYQGRVENFDPLGYVLFVSFFPQLIAGPIVHHSEVMPQFAKHARVSANMIAQGFTLFVIGLAKKALLADMVAQFASPVFNAAAAGHVASASEAWVGALAYSLQIYFDFSGYSDMAIGLALLFGIRLPLNFNSPYKAANIVDFWHRWHMTLSRFLRDYLYIPMGGNRKGRFRRYLNLALTMLLGGLWHGAAWTFVVWGGLHGLYLMANHGWAAFRSRIGGAVTWPERLAGRALTLISVLVAWIFFRAATVKAALRILGAMTGISAGANSAPADLKLTGLLILVLLALAWFAPNSAELVSYAFSETNPKTAPSRYFWKPKQSWALACGVLFALSLMSLTRVTEFLYFQF